MALISTEENAEFEVPKSFASCSGSNGTATQCIHVGGQVSCLRNTMKKRNQISSQCTCQAMVEYILKLNGSFNQLVYNSSMNLEILSNDKGKAQGWPRLVIHCSSLCRTLVRIEYLHMLYTIDFCDQKLWDAECLVRMRRELNN